MSHLKISKIWKCRILWQWSVDGKLDLLGIDAETVSDIHSDLESNTADQAVDLGLEVGAVVDDVHVRVTYPGLGRSRVSLPGLVQPLQPGGVVLHRVVLLRSLGRGDQVDDLVISVVSDIDLVQLVLLHQLLPLLPGDEGGGVHSPSVADDETVPLTGLGQGKE